MYPLARALTSPRLVWDGSLPIRPEGNEVIREFITPRDEAHWLAMRATDLTSTDVAALFGLSPYKTRFDLWHEKKSGVPVTLADTKVLARGRWWEAPIADGVARERGWIVRPFKDYGRLPEHRIGSSFDYRILNADHQQPITATAISRGMAGLPVWADDPRDAILEIKSVNFRAFRDGWTVEDDYIEAPAHIELQVQHQMLVSGLSRAYIAAATDFDHIHVIEREADPKVHAGILAAAAEFWRSIEANEEPEPEMPRDAQSVIAMYQYAGAGVLDMRDNEEVGRLLAEYESLGRQVKEAEARRDCIKAAVLPIAGENGTLISSAGKLVLTQTKDNPGTEITPEMVGQVIGKRSGYRMFRLYPNKEK